MGTTFSHFICFRIIRTWRKRNRAYWL